MCNIILAVFSCNIKYPRLLGECLETVEGRLLGRRLLWLLDGSGWLVIGGGGARVFLSGLWLLVLVVVIIVELGQLRCRVCGILQRLLELLLVVFDLL